MNLGNFLLIDASSPDSTAVGLLDARGRAWSAFVEEKSPALEGIFSAVEKVEKLSGTFPPSGFIFCAGPGSILGIRIAAMAIRGWLALGLRVPVLSFRSLSLHTALILRSRENEKNFAVLAESRMNCWNALRVRDGVAEENFREIKSADLADALPEKIFLLPQRRKIPPPVRDVPELFRPAEFLANDAAVFADVPELLADCTGLPDAVNVSAAETYAKWSPERHRA